MNNIEIEINDFAIAILLRNFRMGIQVGLHNPLIVPERDADLLSLHWAFSESVVNFLEFLIKHRHETQGLIQHKLSVSDFLVHGRIDARSTILAQQLSQNSSLIVSEASLRSFNTSQNRLVAWVIQMVSSTIDRLKKTLTINSPFAELIENSLILISSVQRIESLKEPLRKINLKHRPNLNELRQTAKSRNMIYRLALDAYKTLICMENGDNDTVIRVLKDTLIAPLKIWRRFELAVIVGLGNAFEEVLNEKVNYSFLESNNLRPVLQCGQFAIYWQNGSTFYSTPSLEPSEKILNHILNAYNMNIGQERPDIVIVDEEKQEVISIVEVKFVSSDSVNARFQEAVKQIVRYSRGFKKSDEISKLINNSLIVLSRNAPKLYCDQSMAPFSMDFNGIKSGQMIDWVKKQIT